MASATENSTVFELLNWIEELTFREMMARDLEGIWNGRFNGIGDDQPGDLRTPGAQRRGGDKGVCEGCGKRGRVCGLSKVALQVFQEDRIENHADSQGVHVPNPGQGREVAHLGHFPVGGQMECHAQGDGGPERSGSLEDGGVLEVVPEGYQGSGLSPDR